MKITTAQLTTQITLPSGRTMLLTEAMGGLEAMPYGVMITNGKHSRCIPWQFVEYFEVDHTRA